MAYENIVWTTGATSPTTNYTSVSWAPGPGYGTAYTLASTPRVYTYFGKPVSRDAYYGLLDTAMREAAPKPQRVILPNVQYGQGMVRPTGWRPCGKHPGYRRLVIA